VSRAQLLSHRGKVLGEVTLAKGVSMQEANRESISGRPLRLAPIEDPKAETLTTGAAGGGAGDNKDPKKP
jgi:hypothetical protein